MGDLLNQLSAFAVFLGIAAVGFIFLMVSMIFGEIFDHLGVDHDTDHDADQGGPSFLSPRVLSVFITAFGGAGAIATHFGLSTLASSGAGFLSGLVFGALIFYFAKFLYGQQSSTEVRLSDFAGKTGRVVVPIPQGGVGQVRLLIGEQMVDKMARSKTGSPIAENSTVKVEEILGEIVIVNPQM